MPTGRGMVSPSAAFDHRTCRFDPTEPSMTSATNDLPQIIDRHRRYLELDPRNAPLRLKLSTLLAQAGELEAAADCLQAACGAGDAPAFLFHRLGVIYALQGQWQAAADLLSSAADEEEPDPTALEYLTRALHHLGRVEEAAEAGRHWLAASPTAQAEGYCALLSADCGDIELALFLAKQALARDPRNVEGHLAAGQGALERGEPEPARRHFDAALATDTGCARARYGLALVHLQQQRLDEAVRELTLAGTEGGAAALVTLGWVHVIAGRLADARAVFETAVRDEPGFAEAHGALASAQAMLGDTDIARHTLRTAQGLHAASFSTQFAKAVLLAGDGKAEQAQRLLQQIFTSANRGRSLAQMLAGHPLVREIAGRQSAGH
jgi:tetratricopeptide (TPR) repeat protein